MDKKLDDLVTQLTALLKTTSTDLPIQDFPDGGGLIPELDYIIIARETGSNYPNYKISVRALCGAIQDIAETSANLTVESGQALVATGAAAVILSLPSSSDSPRLGDLVELGSDISNTGGALISSSDIPIHVSGAIFTSANVQASFSDSTPKPFSCLGFRYQKFNGVNVWNLIYAQYDDYLNKTP